jgi:hypothetical protein
MTEATKTQPSDPHIDRSIRGDAFTVQTWARYE